MRTPITLAVLFLANLASAQSEAEPNNAPASANPLEQGGSVSGDLCDGDVDYFDLQPNVQYKLTVDVTASNTDGFQRAVVVQVMDENDLELDQSQGLGGIWGQSLSSTLEDLCFTATGRYLRLSGYPTGCVSYSLSIGHSAPPVFSADPEPNEVAFIATPVALGETWQAQLRVAPDDQNDVFKVVVPARGYLRFIVSAEWSSPHPSDLYFGVSDSTDGQGVGFATTGVAMGANGIAVTDTSRSLCLGAGTYYINPAMVNSGCGISYSATVDLIEPVFGPDPEPNNDTLTAVPLTPDTWAEGQATQSDFPPGDIWDYWRIEKPYEGPLVLYTEASDLSGIYGQGEPAVFGLALVDHEGTWVEIYSSQFPAIGLDGSIAADTTVIPQADAAGSYFVLIPSTAQACYSYRFSYPSVNIAGIVEQDLSPVSVVPNPSRDGFHFNGRDIASVTIRDPQGRLITRLPSATDPYWNTTGASPGVYIAQVARANGRESSMRLVLSH